MLQERERPTAESGTTPCQSARSGKENGEREFVTGHRGEAHAPSEENRFVHLGERTEVYYRRNAVADCQLNQRQFDSIERTLLSTTNCIRSSTGYRRRTSFRASADGSSQTRPGYRSVLANESAVTPHSEVAVTPDFGGQHLGDARRLRTLSRRPRQRPDADFRSLADRSVVPLTGREGRLPIICARHRRDAGYRGPIYPIMPDIKNSNET